MTKAFSILTLVCVVLGLTVGCGGNGEPSKEESAQQIAAAAPAFKMTAKKLFTEYQADDKGASAKYPGKVVVLSGVVTEVGEIEGSPYVALAAGGVMDLGLVSCVFPREAAQDVAAVPKGQNISVKGRVLGKASFAEVRLEKCTLP